MRVFFTSNRSFYPSTSSTTSLSTRRHPAQPVFLPVDIQHNQCPCRFFLLLIEIQALWSQNHDTRDTTNNATSRVDNAMTDKNEKETNLRINKEIKQLPPTPISSDMIVRLENACTSTSTSGMFWYQYDTMT